MNLHSYSIFESLVLKSVAIRDVGTKFTAGLMLTTKCQEFYLKQFLYIIGEPCLSASFDFRPTYTVEFMQEYYSPRFSFSLTVNLCYN